MIANYAVAYNKIVGENVEGNNRGFAKIAFLISDSLSDCPNLQIKIMFLFRNTRFKVSYSEHILRRLL